MRFEKDQFALVGEGGSLQILEHDAVSRKLAMLIEGECEGLGAIKAAEKFGYTKQRYYQIRHAFLDKGSEVLINKPRGPRSNYRRTEELVRQVIRHRFLDPDASPAVIAQKLRQSGMTVSTRSVERVIAEYGLQKKTLQVPSSQRQSKT